MLYKGRTSDWERENLITLLRTSLFSFCLAILARTRSLKTIGHSVMGVHCQSQPSSPATNWRAREEVRASTSCDSDAIVLLCCCGGGETETELSQRSEDTGLLSGLLVLAVMWSEQGQSWLGQPSNIPTTLDIILPESKELDCKPGCNTPHALSCKIDPIKWLHNRLVWRRGSARWSHQGHLGCTVILHCVDWALLGHSLFSLPGKQAGYDGQVKSKPRFPLIPLNLEEQSK